MQKFSQALLGAALLSSACLSYAGAEANFYSCVYLGTPATSKETYTFTSSASHCMYSPGDSNHGSQSFTWTVNVPKDGSGLICSKSQDAYSKAGSSGGDLCASDMSTFQVAMTGPDGQSASARTHWNSPLFSSYEAKIENNSLTLTLCGAKGLCGGTSIDFHGIGNAYLIYKPSS